MYLQSGKPHDNTENWNERNSSVISKRQQSLVRFLRFFHGSRTTFLRVFRLGLVIQASRFHDTIFQLVELTYGFPLIVWLGTWFGGGGEGESLRSRRFWFFRWWRLSSSSRVSSCFICLWFRYRWKTLFYYIKYLLSSWKVPRHRNPDDPKQFLLTFPSHILRFPFR